MPRRKITPDMVEMMRHMRGKGEPVAEIADKLGLSYETVRKYLKKRKGPKK